MSIETHPFQVLKIENYISVHHFHSTASSVVWRPQGVPQTAFPPLPTEVMPLTILPSKPQLT